MTVMPQEPLGLLFLLVGPPGVGKNALMKDVLARSGHHIRQLPTATTRPIRPGEQQGREHLYLSRSEFEDMIQAGQLLEHQVVHGELYGIPRATVEEAIRSGDDLIADIEVLGATYTRSSYPDNTILIFIMPPSLEVLRTRMQARGEPPEAIEKRLQRVDFEMPYAPLCDYVIINDDINQAADRLYAIVMAAYSQRDLHSLRMRNQLPRYKQTHSLTIIPLYNDEILQHEREPYFPTILLTDGKLPADAANDIVSHELGLTVDASNLHYAGWSTSSVELPAVLQNRKFPPEYFQRTALYYLYTLPQRVNVPGWEWLPLEQAALPPDCRNALAALRSEPGIHD